jgi:hypothetical protein
MKEARATRRVKSGLWDLRSAFAPILNRAAHEVERTWRPHDLLDKDEAAAEFHLSVRYLRHLHEKRQVRSYKVGGRVKFRWVDLHDFLESCVVETSNR